MEKCDKVTPEKVTTFQRSHNNQQEEEGKKKREWWAHVARKPRRGLTEAGDVGSEAGSQHWKPREADAKGEELKVGVGMSRKTQGDAALTKAGHQIQIKQEIFTSNFWFGM